MIKDFMWVMQSSTHSNIQDVAVDLITSLAQVVSAAMLSKTLDLQHNNFILMTLTCFSPLKGVVISDTLSTIFWYNIQG
jgi:hypothetical protein